MNDYIFTMQSCNFQSDGNQILNQYLKNGNKPIDEINHVLQTICTRTGANIPKNLTILSPSLIKWENCSTVILHEKMSQSGVTLTSTENEEKSGDKTYFAVVQKIYLETSNLCVFHPAEYHVYTWFLFKAEEKNVYRDTHQSTLKKLLGEAGNKVDSVNDFIFCNDSEQNTVVRTNLGQLDGLQAFILNNNAYGIPLNSISCLDFREYVIDSEMKAAKNVRQNKGVVHWSSTNTKNKTNELNVLEAFFGKIGKSSKKNKKSEINLKESHIKHYCNKTSNVYEMKITKITDISDLVREHQSDIIIVLGDKEEGKTIQSFMQILIVLKRPSNDNAITKDELNRLNNACLIDIFKSEDCYPPDNRVSIGFGGHFMFVLNLWIDKHDMINKIKTLYG